MSRYRVKVESWVVVEARNATDAKATAELALRSAIKTAYAEGDTFADGWHLYGWEAKKAEKVEEGREGER